jgi:hypothetical protein
MAVDFPATATSATTARRRQVFVTPGTVSNQRQTRPNHPTLVIPPIRQFMSPRRIRRPIPRPDIRQTPPNLVRVITKIVRMPMAEAVARQEDLPVLPRGRAGHG